VPAGNRHRDGSQFYNRGLNAIYWSSAVGSSTNAWYREFNYNNAQVNRNLNNRSHGFSVRCVRESKGTSAKETDFFIAISYICRKVRSFDILCLTAGVGLVTAIPSAPIESGNPPSLLFGKKCGAG
jgi:hypothetical protein